MTINSEGVPKNESDEIVFKISPEQYQKLVKWQRKIDERVARQQLETGQGIAGQPLSDLRREIMTKSLERGEPRPDYGAIRGAYVFMFSSNTLGVVVTVKNVATGDEIDLTDYDNW